jgi:hypothetical protein
MIMYYEILTAGRKAIYTTHKDKAIELKEKGHTVKIYTYCDCRTIGEL